MKVNTFLVVLQAGFLPGSFVTTLVTVPVFIYCLSAIMVSFRVILRMPMSPVNVPVGFTIRMPMSPVNVPSEFTNSSSDPDQIDSPTRVTRYSNDCDVNRRATLQHNLEWKFVNCT